MEIRATGQVLGTLCGAKSQHWRLTLTESLCDAPHHCRTLPIILSIALHRQHFRRSTTFSEAQHLSYTPHLLSQRSELFLVHQTYHFPTYHMLTPRRSISSPLIPSYHVRSHHVPVAHASPLNEPSAATRDNPAQAFALCRPIYVDGTQSATPNYTVYPTHTRCLVALSRCLAFLASRLSSFSTMTKKTCYRRAGSNCCFRDGYGSYTCSDIMIVGRVVARAWVVARACVVATAWLLSLALGCA